MSTARAGRSFPIRPPIGLKGGKAITIELPEHLSDHGVAFKEPIPGKKFPEGLPTTYSDASGTYTITWFNSFELQRNGATVKGEVAEYQVVIENQPGKVLFYFDPRPGQGKVVRISNITSLDGGKIAAGLTLGDPPLGWGGN